MLPLQRSSACSACPAGQDADIALFELHTDEPGNGWTFETESGPVEPVFGFGGYLDGIPVDGDSPVAAERVMEEPGQRDLLQIFWLWCGDTGVSGW